MRAVLLGHELCKGVQKVLGRAPLLVTGTPTTVQRPMRCCCSQRPDAFTLRPLQPGARSRGAARWGFARRRGALSCPGGVAAGSGCRRRLIGRVARLAVASFVSYRSVRIHAAKMVELLGGLRWLGEWHPRTHHAAQRGAVSKRLRKGAAAATNDRSLDRRVHPTGKRRCRARAKTPRSVKGLSTARSSQHMCRIVVDWGA